MNQIVDIKGKKYLRILDNKISCQECSFFYGIGRRCIEEGITCVDILESKGEPYMATFIFKEIPPILTLKVL